MRTKKEQEEGGGSCGTEERPVRSVRYRLIVVYVSFLVAAGMVGIAVFVLTTLGSLMR